MTELLDAIIAYIQEIIGVSDDAMSKKAWSKLVSVRMNATHCASEEDYYKYLKYSAAECQALIEGVVVPETWFFRDRSSIDFFVNYASYQINFKTHRKCLHILSIPCSTGEEPYSLVMALLNAHLSAHHFKIDAYDISEASIAKAKLGVFGRHSFRGKDLDYREEFFTKKGDLYLLKENVKDKVHFSSKNVFTKSFSEAKERYEVIFCRNLLIYLQPRYQKLLLENLNQLLLPNGLLIVGPVEAELLRGLGYIPDPHLRSFAFHKRYEFNEVEPSTKLKKPFSTFTTPFTSLNHEVAASPNSIEEARRLANFGYFQQAISICNTVIHEKGPDAEAYFLLGLIEHAAKSEEKAESFFLKTIYLNPYHYPALVYLTLLAEQKGDMHQADLYRNRAVRAASNNGWGVT